MNTKKYLDRLGMGDVAPQKSLDFLNELQYNHVLKIPYENIDIMKGSALDLSPDALFEKIILRKRGGYCFEVNGLLSAFLKELGFEVSDFGARFLRDQKILSFRRHRVVGVRLDGEMYILDVGIGQKAQRYPLKLKAGLVQERFSESYKFEKNNQGEWVLYDLHNGEWREFYSFFEDKWLDVDFEPASFYCENHPKSVFNKDYMLAIKTPNGRKALNGKDFKIFVEDELAHIEENLSDTRLNEVIEKEFGIIL